MTTKHPGPTTFPLRTAMAAVLVAAVFSPVLAFGLLVADVVSMSVFHASVLLAAVNVMAAGSVLVLIAMIASRGPFAVMASFLAGGFVRFLANVAAVAGVTLALPLSYVWIMGLLALAYLPVLMLETLFVGRFLWSMDAPASQGPSQGKTDAAKHDSMKLTEAVA